MAVRIQTADFDVGAEIAALRRDNPKVGAVASFIDNATLAAGDGEGRSVGGGGGGGAVSPLGSPEETGTLSLREEHRGSTRPEQPPCGVD